MDFLKEAKQKAGDAVDDVTAGLKAKLAAIELEKDGLAAQVVAQASAFQEEKSRMLDEWQEEKKKMLISGFMEKYNSIFEYLMGMVLVTLKDMIHDEYMPGFVIAIIDTILDALWPEVKDEVKKSITTELSGEDPIDHGEPPLCGCCGPLALPRYILYPYDRNFWRRIRNPLWWLLCLISVFPLYGVSQIFYFILFLLIDRSDEFQLSQFITEFKSLQFASLGIVSAMLGSIQYYICTSSTPQSCDDDAPRTQLWAMVLFVVQIVVVWTAFLLIKCSSRKGGRYYQKKKVDSKLPSKSERREGFADALKGDAAESMDEENAQLDAELEQIARSRLMNLLIYDFIIFLLCLGLVVWATWFYALDEDARITEHDEGAGDTNWKYHATLFWIRAFYGLMSFPFVLLRIPGISSVFSHAKPTGYNPYGNTVPYVAKEEDGPVPWDPERKFSDPEKQDKYDAARGRQPV